MSHPEQVEFVRLCREHLLNTGDASFIEIGSHNVNEFGVGLRTLFPAADRYVGVDLIDGPGVDLVAAGQEVDFPDASFDVALSCECFEHNPEWRATFRNMYRMTKPGGVVIVTVATGARLEHGTTRTDPKSSPGTSAIGWDYYQNLDEADFRSNFALDEMFSEYRFYRSWSSQDLYFWGVRPGGAGPRKIDYDAIENSVRSLWRLRRPMMTSHGFVLRLSAQMGLMAVYRVTPKRLFQDVALRYRKACYAVIGALGVKTLVR